MNLEIKMIMAPWTIGETSFTPTGKLEPENLHFTKMLTTSNLRKTCNKVKNESNLPANKNKQLVRLDID